jgi:hypothetical protein
MGLGESGSISWLRGLASCVHVPLLSDRIESTDDSLSADPSLSKDNMGDGTGPPKIWEPLIPVNVRKNSRKNIKK